jgi:hypothetical protein
MLRSGSFGAKEHFSLKLMLMALVPFNDRSAHFVQRYDMLLLWPCWVAILVRHQDLSRKEEPPK